MQSVVHRLFSGCEGLVVVDGFCGAGGNTIQLALQPAIRWVLAMDKDPHKLQLARHNVQVYSSVYDRQLLHKIAFLCGDYFELIPALRTGVDMVFLSPPWGGVDYLSCKETSIFAKAFETARELTTEIIMFVPKHIQENTLVTLADPGGYCEIERNMVNGKVKAITAYYGHCIQF